MSCDDDNLPGGVTGGKGNHNETFALHPHDPYDWLSGTSTLTNRLDICTDFAKQKLSTFDFEWKACLALEYVL